MSDGLPTDEQLRRIERGVRRRIERRRQAVQRVAGAAVVVLLVAGGVAAVPTLLSVSSGSSASSAGGSAADPTAAVVTVLCHTGSGTVKTSAARAGLPASALAACAGGRRPAVQAQPESGLSPSPAPTPLLCASPSGVLHVYLGGASTCAEHGLEPRGPTAAP